MKSSPGNPTIPPRFATTSETGRVVEETDGERVQPVCICYGADSPEGDREKAKRIAALLNFAEGVPTEELRGSLLTLAAATTLAAEELRKLRAMTPRRVPSDFTVNLGSVS